MRKFLSLVLALVMTMSLVTVSAGAAYDDAADIDYPEAVDVISAMGIVSGSNGNFMPEGKLTRGAAAKIICNLLLGVDVAADLDASATPFSDVPAGSTFGKYIAYVAKEGIVGGYGDGTFRPSNNVTGSQFLKMLLGALKYDAASEGMDGSDYATKASVLASKRDLTDGIEKFDGKAVLTREVAAQLIFNTLKSKTVTYTNAGNQEIKIGDIVIKNNGVAEYADNDFFYEENFGSLELTVGVATEDAKSGLLAVAADADDEDSIDALGRPAYTWEYDDEEVGTYASAPALVLTDAIDDEDLEDMLEDADLELADGVEFETANGKTVELFAKDDVVYKAVEIAAELLTVTDIEDDKVSTKWDDRIIEIDDDLNVVADSDEEDGVEVANFEALYKALEKDDKVLVVLNAEGDVYSVEIPSVVEAKITKVKGDAVTAGGKTYKLHADAEDDAVVTSTAAKLTVGANGVVYAIEGTDPADGELIYISYIFDTENDKWGNPTTKAQIVTEKYEVAEIVLDPDYVEDATTGFWKYELNDDGEYKLVEDVVRVFADDEIEDDDKYLKIDGDKAYFADDMVVVYIADEGTADLAVTVKEGAQNVTAAHVVLNDDDDVAVVYTFDSYKVVSDDVVFLADDDPDADVADKKGDAAEEYEAYIDGKKVEIMISNAKAGFYTYEIDEETGVYTLGDDDQGYTGVVEITKDKYVSFDDIDDAVVSGDIYDLTDEGLTSLKKIAAWDGGDVTVSFLYDADENEITALYVVEAENLEA